MKEAVDEIELGLAVGIFRVVTKSLFGRDEKISHIGFVEGKGDAVGRSGVSEELPVELRDRLAAYEIDRQLIALDRKIIAENPQDLTR